VRERQREEWCVRVCVRERESDAACIVLAPAKQRGWYGDLQATDSAAAAVCYRDVLFILRMLMDGAHQETGARVREVEDCGWSVQSPRVPCDWSLTGC
jgi:hypothetical protein